jgi:hypothetical protein
MKFAVVAALMAVALPAPALAAEWVLVSNSANGDQHLIDIQSIRTMPNGYKRAWKRADYLEPAENGNTGYKSFDEYDCNGGRKRLLQATMFRGIEVSTTVNSPGNWDYILPDSNAESLFNFVCRK